MAATETVQELIDYYVNLLIIQYHDKPKARATIKLVVETLLMNGVMFDVLNGYSLESNADVWDVPGDVWDLPGDRWISGATVEAAVGAQLDVLGKYEGVDRFYKDIELINYFAFTSYDEVDPDSQPKFGFSTYADFDDNEANGTLQYNDIITVNNRLIDDYFRIIIKLALLQNNMNHSHQAIDSGVYAFFGTSIRPESNGDMHMVYFLSSAITLIIQAIIAKKLLPRPMGVGMLIVTNLDQLAFGFGSYDGIESPYAYGFTDYADFDSVNGTIIQYDQIIQG